MTAHIESKIEDIAKIVLMPGDPLRAKMISEKFLEDAQLVNDVRGMLAPLVCKHISLKAVSRQ